MKHTLAATGVTLNLIASVMLVMFPARKSINDIARDWRTNPRAYTPLVLLIIGSGMILGDLLLT
jgi:hypothetical protein